MSGLSNDSRLKRMLSSLYDYTNNYAGSNINLNRGFAAGTAAALLGMGLDRLESSEEIRKLSPEELEEIQSMAASAEEHNKDKDQSHFVDKFMERLVRHTMPSGSADAESILNRMNDPLRKQTAPLSLRVFALNMKRLSSKMGIIFTLQYGLVHIITWRNPSKTLCVAFLYSAICLWPHLVVALPGLFLLFGMIVPAYLHRHPMAKPEFIKVKRRGQTLLEFLNSSDESSIVTDILAETGNLPVEDVLTASESLDTQVTNNLARRQSIDSQSQYLDELDEVTKSLPSSQHVKKQVSLIMNLRDLQNLTTNLLDSMDKGEKFSSEIVGFKDERLTTFIFYIVCVVTFVVFFLGQYIYWRAIFILSGWAFLLVCHPHAKKILQGLLNRCQGPNKPVAEVAEEKAKEPQKTIFDTFDRQDIIVDDAPEVRIVEIFELQRRNAIKHEWKHFAYSKRLFDLNDTIRISGKLPHGVDSLSKVLPPKEWKYDFGYANNWSIDKNPRHFLEARGIKISLMKLKDDPEGWIYDNITVEQDTMVEFRRRRLYRECYRYLRPVLQLTLA